jgi:hypothetical protein
MDSPWEENPRADYAPEADWAKLSNEFTNVCALTIHSYLIDISIRSQDTEKG